MEIVKTNTTSTQSTEWCHFYNDFEQFPQLNPLSYVAIDTLTDATQLSPTIQLTQLKRTANQCEADQSSWGELSCVGVAIDTSPTQLN